MKLNFGPECEIWLAVWSFPGRHWGTAMKFYRKQRWLTRQITYDSVKCDKHHPACVFRDCQTRSLGISARSSSWRHSRRWSPCQMSIPSYSKLGEPSKQGILFPLLLTTQAQTQKLPKQVWWDSREGSLFTVHGKSVSVLKMLAQCPEQIWSPLSFLTIRQDHNGLLIFEPVWIRDRSTWSICYSLRKD